jgi:hypothetical protein
MQEQTEFDWEYTNLIKLEDFEPDSDIFTDYKRSLKKALKSEFNNCSETNLENYLSVVVYYNTNEEMGDIRRKMIRVIEEVDNPFSIRYRIS